jgi:hypothetical protein
MNEKLVYKGRLLRIIALMCLINATYHCTLIHQMIMLIYFLNVILVILLSYMMILVL